MSPRDFTLFLLICLVWALNTVAAKVVVSDLRLFQIPPPDQAQPQRRRFLGVLVIGEQDEEIVFAALKSLRAGRTKLPQHFEVRRPEFLPRNDQATRSGIDEQRVLGPVAYVDGGLDGRLVEG